MTLGASGVGGGLAINALAAWRLAMMCGSKGG